MVIIRIRKFVINFIKLTITFISCLNVTNDNYTGQCVTGYLPLFQICLSHLSLLRHDKNQNDTSHVVTKNEKRGRGYNK